jgi:hypothetical protein
MKMKQKGRVFSLREPQGAPFPVSEALEDTILHSREPQGAGPQGATFTVPAVLFHGV